MAKIVIIGDGPAGLSAALFLSKNQNEVTVLADDKTPMHYAMLYNYLGIPEITGSEFQQVARDQVAGFGSAILDTRATQIVREGTGFVVTAEGGSNHSADYVVIAEGSAADLAVSLGLVRTDRGIAADADGRTSVDRLYVVGRATRPARSQAIIAAGHGAAAALDIMADVAGTDVQDYDSVDNT
jgi:thioredoxin reductase (NADPH)